MQLFDRKLKNALANVQKPGRYIGGELGSVLKNKNDIDIHFAFAFPDTYEIAMSHLGMKVIYDLLNKCSNIWCERVFMPWTDMVVQLKQENLPLFSLESKTPLRNFDVIGFTLQYELSYTNILAMLDLARIPFYSKDRDETFPIILGAGPCACNVEPLADFFDAVLLGEGEYHTILVCDEIARAKKENLSKHQLLENLAKIEGVYIPSFYDIFYNEDGTISNVNPNNSAAPKKVTKAIIQDFDTLLPPTEFTVPMIGAIHDRAMLEVLRGCYRGCRFCQAGYIYRPLRERPKEMLNFAAKSLCANTGYEEVSLMSLSTSDYTDLEPFLDDLLTWTTDEKINIALPSLRIDNFSESLIKKVSNVRKSGLTFAPEAGTQRLRDIINKNVTEEEIERTCSLAFDEGYSSVKLYFMIGLPGETMDDIKGIADTAHKIVDLYYNNPNRAKGKQIHIQIGCASFIPKPFTPFQFEAQNTAELFSEKQKYLISCLQTRKIQVSYTDDKVSLLEAVFAKGDRRLAKAIVLAYEKGCMFDGWTECFNFSAWEDVFAELNLSMDFYACRERPYEEIMPFDHLDYGITKEFLIREHKKAMSEQVTPPCNLSCSSCGVNELLGRPCFEAV